MVVFLVILTFAVFVTIDVVREHRSRATLLVEGEALHNAIDAQEPHWVGGFKLPSGLGYHQGHTWVHWIAPDQAYVGLDDFARRLLGRGTRFSVPIPGTQVDQGEVTVTARRDGDTVRMASPVGGEIIGINPRLEREPDLPYNEPYGRGWIFKVRSPSIVQELRNLLTGSLAERWMEDTHEQFRHHLMLASGSVIQDGGESVEDIGGALSREEWCSLTTTFLAPTPPTRPAR